jgi:pyrroline-5-carboxylate reductase
VLSIKPQSLPKVGKDLHSKIHPDALVLSIIAGTRISTLQNKLYHDRIVRAMPNTPGQLGKGMTVWTATEHVTRARSSRPRPSSARWANNSRSMKKAFSTWRPG